MINGDHQLPIDGIAVLPAPMTPADCDLQNFKNMPLEVGRLRDSNLASEQTPEENWAALLLWAASWHQVPAASIPDSENWQAKTTGYMLQGKVVSRWRKVRDGVLRNWVLCSDGRLYHPVVAEKANEAWIVKLKSRHLTECKRIKKHNERHGRDIQYPDFDEWMVAGCPTPTLPVTSDIYQMSPRQAPYVASDNVPQQQRLSQRHAPPVASDTPPLSPSSGATTEGKGREGKGIEEKRRDSGIPKKKPSSPPDGAAPAKAEPPTNATWQAYSAAYTARYTVPPVRNRTANGLLKNFIDKLGSEESPMVAAYYVGHQNRLYVAAGHALNLLVRDAEKLRTEWATGRQMTATQAAQADRTQTNFNAFAPLIAEARERDRKRAAEAKGETS